MKATIFTITFLNILNSILSLDKCDSFKCVNSLVGSLCMVKDSNTTNLVDLQVCDEGNYCLYNLKAYTGTCKRTDYSTLQYLGASCNKKSDCVSAAEFCDNNTCIRNSTSSCVANGDCAIGSFCNTTAPAPSCVPQQAAGQKCSSESDCVNSAGCLNGVCVAYLTLEDGANVAADTNEHFCKSGFALNSACATASLSSSADCTVSGLCTYNANNTQVNSTAACVCGKNYEGKRFCRYGADAPQAKSALALKQRYLSLLNSTKCQTEERFVPCSSTAFDLQGGNTHNEFEYKKTLKNAHNQIVLNSVSFGGIAANDTCVLPVVGGYDRSIIAPLSRLACPKYNCATGQKACGSSMNPNNFDSSEITVTLSKGFCAANQTCSTANLKDVYEKQSAGLECESKSITANRYPGEKCASNNDCRNKNCTVDNVCSHVKVGEACSSIDLGQFCGLDAYCVLNATSGNSTCVAQKSLKEACQLTFECKNNLGCYNKTCSLEFGSKDESFEFNSALFSVDLKNPQFFCKSMEYDTKKARCITYKYNNMTVNGDGYVECSRADGKECKYVTNLNDTVIKSCQCGFNADGKSYCPIDFGKRNFLIFLLF